MTLDEAIEVNTAVENCEMCCWMPKALEAQELGNEALKMIKEGRCKPGGMFFHDLPGETKE